MDRTRFRWRDREPAFRFQHALDRGRPTLRRFQIELTNRFMFSLSKVAASVGAISTSLVRNLSGEKPRFRAFYTL
jgi:hypothetical protein